ncbi:MAG: FAD-dependent oxidoreductase, partial [Candidatus Competibacteraceae bacterium]|nr:FAD-dependent oxidoreductase [Candidatus Competibacteraceae bacterium]
ALRPSEQLLAALEEGIVDVAPGRHRQGLQVQRDVGQPAGHDLRPVGVAGAAALPAALARRGDIEARHLHRRTVLFGEQVGGRTDVAEKGGRGLLADAGLVRFPPEAPQHHLLGLDFPHVVGLAGHAQLLLLSSDAQDGFLLDRGFQVLQTAYPEARRWLDYSALDLRPFRPGALIRHAGRFHRIGDPLRRPADALPTLFSPIGTWADKLRILRLRHRVLQGNWSALFNRPETSTVAALRADGFSENIIERFFRPFLAGVFFDEHLATSSRTFEFVFRAFASGDTALPAQGMESIPKQLAARLPTNVLRLNTPVANVEDRVVRLVSGEQISASAVVVATEAGTAAQLLGDTTQPVRCPTTCLYFAAPEPPLQEPLLVLNGDGTGPLNSLLVPSVLSADYAPPGQALITVNVLGNPVQDDAVLEVQVRAQLRDWFGAGIEHWRLLRIYRIAHALPAQLPPAPDPDGHSPQINDWLFLCGEYRNAPSIQWALASGRKAAQSVAKTLAAPSH